MNPELITVVMPLYNHVEYVKEAIESILNQTHKHLELIIVDDGSTDGSSDIAEFYSQKEERVSYIYKTHGGTGSALNEGFGRATGMYGTWVSSDNVYYTMMLETLLDFLKSYGSEFVFSCFDVYDLENYSETTKIIGYNTTGLLENFITLSYSTCLTGICYLFTMNVKNKCGEYINIPGEDYYMGVLMGTHTPVGYIATSLGKYRRHPKSVSSLLIDKPFLHLDTGGKSAVEKVKELIVAYKSGK
jgi:glycosyltransferase involved in cell wall biosynthesis